jgi:CubicO group peptidase (beta-lactamase class C family)
VLLIAVGGAVVCHEAFGMRQLLPEPLPATTETVFDLASLTKPLATALAAGLLLAEGKISLEAPLAEFLPAPPDKEGISLRQLLSHSSGLPAWRPYFHRLMSAPPADRPALLTGLVLEEPLEALPGEAACYSDLGYMLLGAVVERAAGSRLDQLAAGRIFGPLGLGLHFRPLGEASPAEGIAATENCQLRGRILCGEVHDETCWAAGGVCGHAGLFGTAGGVAALLLHLRRVVRGEAEGPLPASILREIFRRQRIRARFSRRSFSTVFTNSSALSTCIRRMRFGRSYWTSRRYWVRSSGVVFMDQPTKDRAGRLP